MSGTLLLVRPPAQAARLQGELAAAGVAAEPFCVLDLQADTAALTSLPAQAAASDAVVFVSPSAIDIAWPALAGHLPPAVQLVCVGRRSGEQLATLAGRTVLFPAEGNDSDALLALPALQTVSGQSWLIVRGDRGRAQLGETLARRGAHVRYAAVYHQVALTPDWPRLADLASHQQLAGLLVGSSELAEALFADAGPLRPTLAAQSFFTLHPRIADRLRALGAAKVTVCDGQARTLAALLAN